FHFHLFGASAALASLLLFVPQIARGFAPRISERVLKGLLLYSAFIGGVTLGHFIFETAPPLATAAWLSLIGLLLAFLALRGGLGGIVRGIQSSVAGLFAPHYGAMDAEDRELSFCLARSQHLVLVGTISFLATSAICAPQGELSLRLALTIGVSSALIAPHLACYLGLAGLIWGGFAFDAGLDARIAATLANSGALYLVMARLCDGLLTASFSRTRSNTRQNA
ncbi:MAG: hypothetical protein KDB07_06155, partial [Planctomycetes bacterium]|nr:hypothetical protein [Planctomycetota bacterium]